MTGQPLQLGDQAQRQQAIDPRHSFVVQAPAGSGKTGLLVRRVLSLLASANVPEEILCITFTRKATREMQDRILNALAAVTGGFEDASAGDFQQDVLQLARGVAERDREMGWNLLANPARLAVQTIDSLCYDIVRSMPWSSRFGAPPDIIDQQDMRELYREAARRTLQQIDQQAGQRTATTFATGSGFSTDIHNLLVLLDAQFSRAQALLADMLAKRDHWLRGIDVSSRPELERMWGDTIETDLQALVQAIPDDIRTGIIALLGFAAGNMTDRNPDDPLVQWSRLDSFPDPVAANTGLYRSMCKLLVVARNGHYAGRKQVNVNNGFPPGSDSEKEHHKSIVARLADVPDLFEMMGAALDLPDPNFSDRQWDTLSSLLSVLPMAAAELQLMFAEDNSSDYTEVGQRAELALGDDQSPTDMALSMDYRIRHILMDEAQDVSLAQVELLSRLVRGWEPGDGRTLFFVGDPMQSIYRFRQADIAQFLNIRDHGIGTIEPAFLVLESNFRSSRRAVDWCNTVFAASFPARDNPVRSAVSFSPGTAIHDDHPDSAIRLLVRTRDAAHHEASHLAALIAEERLRRPQFCIGVLGRSRAHLARIATELHATGVSFQAVELQALSERPAIQDLMSLTRALMHPGDRVAWLSVLRAPWCGLELVDLCAVGGNATAMIEEQITSPACLDQVSTDGRQRLQRLMQRLEGAVEDRGRRDLSSLVYNSWMRLNGPSCAGENEIDNCERFFDLLREQEASAKPLTAERLLEATRGLWARPGTEQGVQLMTIHKSKGLEFDTVVIPTLDGTTRPNATELVRWTRVGDSLLVSPLSHSDETTDPFNTYLKKIEKVRQSNEDQRLLYVACTRARHRLFLSASLRISDDGEITRPDRRSLLDRLWPVLEEQFVRALDIVTQPQSTEPESDPAERTISRLDSSQPLYSTETSIAGPDIQPASSAPESPEFSWATDLMRETGIAVHQVLQDIGSGIWPDWADREVTEIGTGGMQYLQAAGLSGNRLHKGMTLVQRAILNIQQDPRAHWLFSPEHREQRSEWALTAMLDGELVSVRIDRSFVDDSGQRWIIDFKSGRHEDRDVDTFMQQEKMRYLEQMTRYARVVSRLDDRPVRLALYYPMFRGWIEWVAQSD